MKYFVLIPDGMADRRVPDLGNKTPMEAAKKQMMDELCAKSVCGTALNVPVGMVPESDTANLSILSYNPQIYSKGRSLGKLVAGVGNVVLLVYANLLLYHLRLVFFDVIVEFI